MNVLKKIFSVSVTFTTVLWSLGVSALVPAVAVAASCPTLNPGDMIKVSGKAAIYVLNNDKKALYFPSGDVFKSWRPTYGGYISITQDCYDSILVPSSYPGGVNFMPGSYVVKRPSSDQLYVVEPGNTLAKIDTAAAKALYGASYKVMTIDDQFWPNYVNRGPDISGSSAQAHPGMLVSNGGKNWYVDSTGKLWEVTASGMTANGFQSKFVRSVASANVSGLTQGGTLDTMLASITDKTQSGGVTGGTTTPGTTVSGSMNVSLASDNPFSSTIVSDGTYGAQANIKVMKLVFSAGNDGDATVTKVVLTRGGISADTDISNMYLFDGNTLVGANPSVLSNKVTFSNPSGLFTVARGSSKSIEVRLDLRNDVSAGKTLMFSVASAGDVMTTGNASVGGTYPLVGNTFTTAAVSDLGKLLFENSAPSAAGTVDPGTSAFEVWKVKLTNTNQDMEVRKLKFTIVGSVNVGDLKNLSLWDGSAQIGSTQTDMASDKTVTFDLTGSPYVVTKGQVKYLSLKADVVAGTNRTFYASFQNSADIVVYDKNYNVFVKPNGTDTFAIVQAGGNSSVNWSINVGTLVQTLGQDSPNGNVADGGTSVTLAKFLWKANGEDVKVTSLSVSSTGNDTSDVLSNVRLLVDGSQVGTTITSLTANGASNSGWGSFGSSFVIKAASTATVTVVADLTHSSVAADATFRVGFAAGSSNGQGVTSLTNISTVAQNANTVTVKAGTVGLVKNASFGERTSANPTGTVNGTQVKVGSFVITAGAGEDVTLSQITIQDKTAGTCVGTYMKNLTLKDANGKQLGQTYPNPSASCATVNTFTFNISPSVTITNGSQYSVDVFADLVASFTTANTALMNVTAVAAQGKSTGSTADYGGSAVSMQTVYIASAGALMVQTDSDTAVANNYVMGATNQDIGKFKVSASSTEAVTITQLVVSAKFSGSATGTVKNIRLIDNDTGLQVGNAVSAFSDTVAGTSAATTTYSHATFSGMSFTVPAGSSKTLVLRVDFSTYQDGGFSTTGQTVIPTILASYYGTSGTNNPVTASGASSGSSLTATVSNTGSVITSFPYALGAYGATTTLYRAKLTTAWAGDTPSGAATPGAAQVVAKVVVTNLSNAGNYAATVSSFNLNFSTTISNSAGSSAPALTIYKDTLATTALATTYFSYDGTSGTAPLRINNTSIITDANFTDVDVAAGGSKTFWATVDTSGAVVGTSLSVRVPSGGVVWTDGVTTGLTVMGQDLPLVYKTFTY